MIIGLVPFQNDNFWFHDFFLTQQQLKRRHSSLCCLFRFEAVDAGNGSESLDNYTARWFSISITQVLSVSEIL